MRSKIALATEAVRLALPLAILGGAATGAAWIGQKPEPERRTDLEAKPALVETAPIQAYDQGLDIEVDGNVVPHREVALAAEVAGRVVYKAPDARAGRYVKQGELLFRIDPEFYRLEVERLTEELEQAAINIDELEIEAENTLSLVSLAEEQLQLQQKQLERLKRLSASRSASESERDQEFLNELSARNNLLTLQNQVRILRTRKSSMERSKALVEAKLKQAKLDLNRTELRAPFDAVVVEESIEQQEYVQPGTALVTLQDTSAVEVQCSLRMEELQWIWEQASSSEPASDQLVRADYELPGTPATVVYRLNDRDYEWDGMLTRYDGIGLDEQTRTVPVRVLVPSPRAKRHGEGAQSGPPALVRGMFVRVKLHVSPTVPLFRLPETAVRPGNQVWRVRDGKLDILPIHVARIVADHAIAPAGVNGLAPGDRMIVSPLSHAEEGMPVTEVLVR